jgi:rubredoxin
VPALRTVNCPKCGLASSTKAGEGTRLRCKHCDHVFRAPKPEPVDPPPALTEDTGSAEQPAPAASTKAAPAAGGGVTVRRADGITVKRAKPKAPPKKKITDTQQGDRPADPPLPAPAKRAAPARGSGGKFASKAGAKPPAPPPAVPRRGGGVGYFQRRVRRAG